jgi:hypothetical protein
MTENDRNQLFVDPKNVTSYVMYSHWRFVLKWIVPMIILLGLFLQILGFIFK